MTVYIRRPIAGSVIGAIYYKAEVSLDWARRHDNGAIISCGLTIGEKGLTERQFDVLRSKVKVVEITQDEWNHSGCQSECIRRGGKECRW